MFIQFLGTAASVYGVLGDQIAPAGAVSEHFGAGQLLLVAHDASGPCGGRIKRTVGPDPASPLSRQETEPTMNYDTERGGPR